MTVTEIVVIVGGLVLGYWIVSVLLPALGRDRDDPGADDSRSPADAEAGDGETVVVEKEPRDEPPIRRGI